VAKLPISPSKAIEALREASDRVDQPVDLVAAGNTELVELAVQRLAEGGQAQVGAVSDVGKAISLQRSRGDVLVILASVGEESEIRALLANKRLSNVVLVVDEGSSATGQVTRLHERVLRLSFSDSQANWDRLFKLCVKAAGDGYIALARRYPVLRHAAARRLVGRTAAQNGVIGLLFILPGADMPAMTLNQIKMILSMAGIFGQEMGVDRALELAAVVGLGFGFRTLARRFLRFVPGLGLLVKAGTGYAATMAVGLAAIEYFEEGAPASAGRVVALAGSLRH